MVATDSDRNRGVRHAYGHVGLTGKQSVHAVQCQVGAQHVVQVKYRARGQEPRCHSRHQRRLEAGSVQYRGAIATCNRGELEGGSRIHARHRQKGRRDSAGPQGIGGRMRFAQEAGFQFHTGFDQSRQDFEEYVVTPWATPPG